jgi:NAD(P)-dependent dehydrogenase (short-subunit alcohol dehydrogenase family)
MQSPAYVILGATGGIGSELCRILAATHARLAIAARTANVLSALAEDLKIRGAADVLAMPCEATDSESVNAFVESAVAKYGALAGVTCLTGSILLKPAHLTTDAELADTFSVNVNAAFYTVRAAAKAMMATGGSIVLASTVAAQIGLSNHEAIAAAKGAIDGLTLSAAATYAPKNIRVNAVAPGLVRTPLAAKITSSELALKASTAMHPLGRIGEPGDVARLIAFLLDPANAWITGQIVGVDGGLGSVRAK